MPKEEQPRAHTYTVDEDPHTECIYVEEGREEFVQRRAPGAPSAEADRDQALAFLGWVRTGPWADDAVGGATAPVRERPGGALVPSVPQVFTAGGREAAAMKVSLSLGEENPAVIDQILQDLRQQEGMSWEEIGALPPELLSDLDDRYGWLSE